MLALPEIQMVAVCDPNKESTDYVEWGKDDVRRTIANGIGQAGLESRHARVSLADGKSAGKWSNCIMPDSALPAHIKDALPTRISANCWKRKKTWMR